MESRIRVTRELDGAGVVKGKVVGHQMAVLYSCTARMQRRFLV
jgi:hypothetical protein